eukprot:TRINITY_DN39065_c0_g1_i1.p1 TRINITY_DN39065_c0_g1~~TRINITY_DN39065_c0_g1_i1.p1  ORF type:complete len:296 (+),score=80.95 TRINITY_DN39065_c0_g1_i1:57-890(+)
MPEAEGTLTALALAALDSPGDLATSHRATASAGKGERTERQLAALEARVLSMLSAQQVQHTAELREADRFTEFANKNMEKRIEAVEQKQLAMESKLAELSAALEERAASCSIQACALPADGHGGCAANALTETQRAGAHEALLAVESLDSILQEELKAVSKRCNQLQELVEECAIAPLGEVERQLREHCSAVKQMLGATEDYSSRVEEHDVKLGVLRTKLEVFDQRFFRLESMRWSPKADSFSTCTGGANSTCAVSRQDLGVDVGGEGRLTASLHVP